MSAPERQVRFTFENPSADALEALFPRLDPSDYEVTLDAPARRRTVWEWLTRKPRHGARRIFLPSVQLAEPQEEERAS